MTIPAIAKVQPAPGAAQTICLGLLLLGAGARVYRYRRGLPVYVAGVSADAGFAAVLGADGSVWDWGRIGPASWASRRRVPR